MLAPGQSGAGNLSRAGHPSGQGEAAGCGGEGCGRKDGQTAAGGAGQEPWALRSSRGWGHDRCGRS
jgi:hypothetical protein